MMRLAIVLAVLGLAACDPIWGVNARLRDPADQPVERATLAIACAEGGPVYHSMAVRTDTAGHAFIGSVGGVFPVGCDVYIAKPGYRTQRIRYRQLCPNGPDNCDRMFQLDLVLEPETVGVTGPRRPPPRQPVGD
jgi:hypothetical protein